MNAFFVRSIITIQNAWAALQQRARKAEQGQGMVEYALILAFIAVAIIVAMKLLQPAITSTYNHVGNCLYVSQTAIPGTPTPGAGC